MPFVEGFQWLTAGNIPATSICIPFSAQLFGFVFLFEGTVQKVGPVWTGITGRSLWKRHYARDVVLRVFSPYFVQHFMGVVLICIVNINSSSLLHDSLVRQKLLLHMKTANGVSSLFFVFWRETDAKWLSDITRRSQPQSCHGGTPPDFPPQIFATEFWIGWILSMCNTIRASKKKD